MILVINLFWYQDHKLQDIISQLQIELDNQEKHRQIDGRTDKREREREREIYTERERERERERDTQRERENLEG